MKIPLLGFGLLAVATISYSCQKDDDATVVPTGTTTGAADITAVVQAKYLTTQGVTISTSGNSITLKSDGLPHNHKTPYWGVGHALYEDFPTGYHANVNTSMSARNYSMTLAASPGAA